MTRLPLRAALFGASALVALVAAPAFADPAPRVLTVSGHGEASGAPDTAQLSAGVTTQGKTAAAALAENARRMTGVFAALKRIGVADKDMQTSNFNVSPQYAPYVQGSAGPQRIAGYEVSNQVNVKLHDVAKTGPALDALVASGANQINSVSFGIDDSKALLASARGDAVADATARAETYARAAHVSLGNIVSITDTDMGTAPPPMMMRAMAGKADSTPVAMGEETLSANVTIVWEIR
jgi:uncharacterized protein YggE